MALDWGVPSPASSSSPSLPAESRSNLDSGTLNVRIKSWKRVATWGSRVAQFKAHDWSQGSSALPSAGLDYKSQISLFSFENEPTQGCLNLIIWWHIGAELCPLSDASRCSPSCRSSLSLPRTSRAGGKALLNVCALLEQTKEGPSSHQATCIIQAQAGVEGSCPPQQYDLYGSTRYTASEHGGSISTYHG